MNDCWADDPPTHPYYFTRGLCLCKELFLRTGMHHACCSNSYLSVQKSLKSAIRDYASQIAPYSDAILIVQLDSHCSSNSMISYTVDIRRVGHQTTLLRNQSHLTLTSRMKVLIRVCFLSFKVPSVTMEVENLSLRLVEVIWQIGSTAQ